MAGRIVPAHLVEHVVTEIAILENHAPALQSAELMQNVGLDEGERGQRGGGVLVQAEVQAPVRDDRIGMRPGLADLRL